MISVKRFCTFELPRRRFSFSTSKETEKWLMQSDGQSCQGISDLARQDKVATSVNKIGNHEFAVDYLRPLQGMQDMAMGNVKQNMFNF
ncbi:unnamed protein product [Allacma fusca]|uniref:Uncharacterized protein n=1 Tax=Allacma fusca TaxID=39272 RepID=A0A8J2NQC2_9HEXA|nr:unnamed protein product [Allacma fusca]